MLWIKSLVDNILADGSKIYGYIQKNLYITQKRMKIFVKKRRPCQNRRQKAKEYLDKAKAELNGDVAIELLSRDGDSDRKLLSLSKASYKKRCQVSLLMSKQFL